MGRLKKDDPIKYCHYCNKKLERKIFGSRLEDLSRFKKRKYCDKICMAIDMIKQDKLTDSGYLKRARKLLSETCELCSKSDDLEAHHIDRNRSNNDVSNIQTLCRSCHMKLHWSNGDIPHKKREKCKLCDEPAKGHGLCKKHYSRWYRNGNPMIRFGKIES